MSVANEITRLREAKDDLKTSINAKNAPNNQITNETIDGYASFVDLIPQGGITPTGTINITQGGVYDVTNYASANVDIPIGPNELISEVYTWDNTYINTSDWKNAVFYFNPNESEANQPTITSGGSLGKYNIPSGQYLVEIVIGNIDGGIGSSWPPIILNQKSSATDIETLANYSKYSDTYYDYSLNLSTGSYLRFLWSGSSGSYTPTYYKQIRIKITLYRLTRTFN